MRSTKTALLAIAVATLMGMLPGCGSNRTGAESTGATAGPFGVDAENRPYVGADQCVICHEGDEDSDAVADYLVGSHVIHSHDVDASMSRDGCLLCHDPIGDGRRLEGLIAADDVPAAGLAAVTCEACHGAGGQHYGVGPIPIASPDYTVCGNCHSAGLAIATAGHNDFTEADDILKDYKASPHFDSLDHDELLWGASVPSDQLCVKCHTDEGGRLYRDVSTEADLSATLSIAAGASPIQCRTCHNAHNPGELLKPATNSVSTEYATCTNCHQRHDAQLTTDPDPSGDGTADGASGDLIYHSKRWDRVISSTHYDDPGTPAKVEGYSMDPSNERVCRDCHNVHTANITVNEQWARSGHGGELLTIKEDAAALQPDNSFAEVQEVRAAGSTSSWAADVWPTDAKKDCQRCHTATGGKNFIIDSASYAVAMKAYIDDPATNPSPNDFSYLEDGAHEMLFCWTCHSDNTGALRTEAAVNLIDRDNAIFATIPAKGKSTVCIGCHGGRVTGGYTTASDVVIPNYYATVALLDRSNESLVHHLPAAASLFSAQTHSAYEFAFADQQQHYADKSYFAHNKIGLNLDSPETGDGPCATCHMVIHPVDDGDPKTDADAVKLDHGLQALGLDGEGFAIINNQVLCDGCHGVDMTRAQLDLKKAGFEAARELLRKYVENDTVTNKLGLNLNDSTNLQTPLVTVDYFGAEQNYRFLVEEAGAYVHNSLYAKRLIFDSINLLLNGNTDALTLDLTGQDAAYNYLVTRNPVTQDPLSPQTAMTRP